MEPTVDLAKVERRRECNRRWREANQEKIRAYREANKATEHKEAALKFEAERARERERHMQMKAAQLRRSIMRSGEYPDTVWLGDIMRDLVRYVAEHVPPTEADFA